MVAIKWRAVLRWTAWIVLTLVIGVAIYAGIIGRRALFPTKKTTSQRLDQFPKEPLPLRGNVQIYWNDYQVPFVDAEHDEDAAFCLGLIHAHLRGTQLALLKRVSQGRLAEIGGPPAVQIDEALRTLDFGYAADDMIAAMPAETRAWVQRFVDGLNFYQEHSGQKPPEFSLFAFKPEPYTLRDVVCISRLAGTDISWITMIGGLQARQGEDWPEIYDRILNLSERSTVSFESGTKLGLLGDLLLGNSRSGSNSVVIAPEKSVTGAAMIANDPHLGQAIPNFWILAGFKSPSYHVLGMMVPGLPFAGLGRNQHLAWGGTNMNAASSDLYDVSSLPESAFTEHEETIKVRFGRDKTIRIRRSPFGPVLTDAQVIPRREGDMLAMRWVGHEPSDEISAFLRANRADSPDAFRDAFRDYAVSGQTLLFADGRGNIGLVPAVTLPDRGYQRPPAFPLDAGNPDHHWRGLIGVNGLPWTLNPPEGFVASANNRAMQSDPPIGFYFAQSERIDRLNARLLAEEKVDLAWLKRMQQDVVSTASRDLGRGLANLLRERGLDVDHEQVVTVLGSWDGSYDASAAEPVWFETLLYHVANDFFTQTGRQGAYYNNWNYLATYLLDDVRALPDNEQSKLLTNALEKAAADRMKFSTWGEMHRLRARFVLGAAPLIGGRFTYADMPTSGSRETVFKTAHGLVNDRHGSTYGAQSRHISVLDDLDENYFVLFGGQDGWLGSENFVDQVPLFMDGDYIQIPMRLNTVRQTFRYTMRLEPGKPIEMD